MKIHAHWDRGYYRLGDTTVATVYTTRRKGTPYSVRVNHGTRPCVTLCEAVGDARKAAEQFLARIHPDLEVIHPAEGPDEATL